MKLSQKERFSLLFGIICLIALAACGTRQTSPAEPPAFTAEDAAALFLSRPNSFPNFVVDEVIPYGSDFLVIRRAEHGSGEAVLHWVFSTGQEVNIWNGYAPAYSILAPGVVQIESNGRNPSTGWQGMPERTTRMAVEDDLSRLELGENIWLPVEQPWMVGFPVSEAEASDGSGRFGQLLDACGGITDLQFSFIPSGDPERFQTFFPAATSVPNVYASFEPKSRRFTLRLHNTCLSSGGIADQAIHAPAYKGLYPCAFPEGALETDSPWFFNAQITQEDEDTLVALTLSSDVLSYRIETGNLGDDTVPWLRVAFSNQETNWN